MKNIVILVSLLLVSCASTNDIDGKKDERPSINNVIEVIKNIQLPKM